MSIAMTEEQARERSQAPGKIAAQAMVHISSAVVRALPNAVERVAQEIEASEGMEVAMRQEGRLVVVMETRSAGATGDMLTRLSLLDGVLSACMVYEHAEPAAELDALLEDEPEDFTGDLQ